MWYNGDIWGELAFCEKVRFLLDTNLGGGTLKSMNKMNPNIRTKLHGFTIVELLIVIVVIAILAAISIAAYTNIQQRAKNTAIINAASQSLKMIQAYIAANGTYPLKGNACITVESGCSMAGTVVSMNSTFNTNMATVGTLSKSVPVEGNHFGLMYLYSSLTTFNSESQPAYLRYYLFGTSQPCRVPGVMAWLSSDTYGLASSNWTNSNVDGTGKTECRITIPGPAHS